MWKKKKANKQQLVPIKKKSAKTGREERMITYPAFRKDNNNNNNNNKRTEKKYSIYTDCTILDQPKRGKGEEQLTGT